MFCQCCLTCIRAAIQDLYSTYPHAWGSKILHKSLSEFHQSVVAQCWFCRQLWTSLLEKEAACVTEDDNSTQAMDQFSILSERWEKSCIQLGVSVKDSYLKLDLCIFQDPTAEFGLRRFKSFILSPKPHNIEVLRSYLGEEIFANDGSGIRNASMWRQWFRTCSESHKRCRALDQKSKNFLPDRLLKVSTNDGGKSFTWKLVLSTGLEDTSYITLSHCWGASQHEILTKGNFDDRMKPTSSSKLPKSFQHAFYIAFKLGFRFIWIDSLCIIQKDEADWLTQASMMGSIYENASCNIAATWAKDGDGGCFTTSEDRSILLNFPFGKTWEYQADDYRFYYDDILEAPLNRRGWVTQERYLAKRQLNFAKSGVYWECRELIASELYPCGIPKTLRDMSPYNQARPPEGSPTLDYPDTMQRRRAWAGLVDFYSNCAFTNISDKMIALAGLARQMSLMEEDTYLAGLWKKDIQSQLCWTIENDVRRKDDWSRISPYLAPTWSWASIDGPVRSDQRYYLENVKYESLVKVLDISIQSEHESKLHRFTRSSLTLQGIAVWARPKLSKCGIPSNHEGGWILQCTDLQSDGSTTEISVHIVWDEYWSESSANMKKRTSILSQRDSDLLCLLVHYDIDDAEFVGLLLRQHRFPADEVSYTRMGIFTTNGENPLGMLSARLNYISSYPIVRGINLHSTNLSRFVHTAVIF